ncbi:MAG: CPBP family intramembrane glutamic endopeptidase [Acidimicrobiia bacterium]
MLPERAYVPVNLAVAGGLVAYARHSGATWEDLGLEPSRLPSGALWGVAAAVGAGAAIGTISALEPTRPLLLDERALGHTSAQAAYRATTRFPLGTALFEEVAFRGVVEGLWARRVGTRRAAVVTATAFGCWHLLPTYRASQSWALPTKSGSGAGTAVAVAGAVATGAASLGFSWLRRRSGGLLAPWTAHAAFNTLSYLAARRAWQKTSV